MYTAQNLYKYLKVHVAAQKDTAFKKLYVPTASHLANITSYRMCECLHGVHLHLLIHAVGEYREVSWDVNTHLDEFPEVLGGSQPDAPVLTRASMNQELHSV